MPPRIDLKITTSNNHWYTGFNGTKEEAEAYFMGRVFEGHTAVVKVEVIDEQGILCPT